MEDRFSIKITMYNLFYIFSRWNISIMLFNIQLYHRGTIIQLLFCADWGAI